MKKLVLTTILELGRIFGILKIRTFGGILGIFVFGTLGVANLSAQNLTKNQATQNAQNKTMQNIENNNVKTPKNAQNLSDEQFMQLAIDCANNQNKISCQRVIDSSNLEQCNKTTCNIIGSVFFLSADYKQAMKYYQKAADLGNAWGYNNLGFLHNEGQGVQQNFTKAFKLYEKACDLSLAAACYNLGNLYYEGKGVRQDFVDARKHYEYACGLNNAQACNDLGYLYDNEQGVRQNFSAAKKYFGKACDLDFQMGCDNYRKLNERGVE